MGPGHGPSVWAAGARGDSPWPDGSEWDHCRQVTPAPTPYLLSTLKFRCRTIQAAHYIVVDYDGDAGDTDDAEVTPHGVRPFRGCRLADVNHFDPAGDIVNQHLGQMINSCGEAVGDDCGVS